MKLSLRLLLAAMAFTFLLPTVHAADSPQRLFAKSWEGRKVVLKQSLYTLVYDERATLGHIRAGRRDGLVVINSSRGMYFQFDGRHGKDDVVVKDPQRMVDTVKATYVPDTLEVRSERRVDPVVVHRYDVGGELYITRVRIERDFVRVWLAQTAQFDPDADPATSFTIKWPVPFHKSFSERELVDDLMRLIVEVKTT